MKPPDPMWPEVWTEPTREDRPTDFRREFLGEWVQELESGTQLINRMTAYFVTLESWKRSQPHGHPRGPRDAIREDFLPGWIQCLKPVIEPIAGESVGSTMDREVHTHVKEKIVFKKTSKCITEYELSLNLEWLIANAANNHHELRDVNLTGAKIRARVPGGMTERGMVHVLITTETHGVNDV